MIEAFHYTDEQGFIAWRARGHTARSMPDLAAALGVEEHQVVLRLEPAQLAQIERERKRRPRKSADEAFWSHYHGHE